LWPTSQQNRALGKKEELLKVSAKHLSEDVFDEFHKETKCFGGYVSIGSIQKL